MYEQHQTCKGKQMNTTSIYTEMQASLRRGERIAVATVVKTIGAAPCGVGTKMMLHSDGATSGTFGGTKVDTQVAQEALKALQESRSYLFHVHLDADQAVGSCADPMEMLVEILHPEPRLSISGAGNCAQALTRLVVQVGCRIGLADTTRRRCYAEVFNDKVQLTFGD